MKIVLKYLLLTSALCCAGTYDNVALAKKSAQDKGLFPVSLQYFEIGQDKTFVPSTFDSILNYGITNMWIRDCKSPQSWTIVDHFQKSGMKIDFMTHGHENFNRDEIPPVSVYAQEYESVVSDNVKKGLSQLKRLKTPDYVFPYIDEPFHRKPNLDFSAATCAEFRKRYGYDMPKSFDEALRDPKVQLDFLNFQSNIFRDGWLKTQKIVRQFDPRAKIAMTHDSHNCYGGGVNSNSQMAMDDVFHWGGDYADLFVYDIYPYLTFDYRYGETGVYRKPRMSQLHYTMAQLRNMTTAYGKKMGFWVGTYNPAWFVRFHGKLRESQFWSEREVSYTAIAGGADYLILPSDYMGYNLPVEQRHWDEFGRGIRVIQKEGAKIVEAPKVRANACFIFPRTQYLLLQQEYYNVGLAYELVLRAFGEVDILHEDQITDNRLNGYKAVVMCDVKLLPRKTAERVASYVAQGGVLIADCIPSIDESRQPLSTMLTLAGVSESADNRIKRAGQWVPFVNLPSKFSFPPASGVTDSDPVFDNVSGKWADKNYNIKVVSPRVNKVSSSASVELNSNGGVPALIRRKVGSGAVNLFGFCLQDTYFHACKTDDQATLNSLYALVSEVFDRSGVQSHVRSSNPDIEAALRSNDSVGYVFAINHESSDPHTEITLKQLPSKANKIVDVETGKEASYRQNDGVIKMNVEVPFGKTSLYKIYY